MYLGAVKSYFSGISWGFRAWGQPHLEDGVHDVRERARLQPQQPRAAVRRAEARALQRLILQGACASGQNPHHAANTSRNQALQDKTPGDAISRNAGPELGGQPPRQP